MTRRRCDVLTLIIASLIISIEEASVNVRDQAETNAPVTRQNYVCTYPGSWHGRAPCPQPSWEQQQLSWEAFLSCIGIVDDGASLEESNDGLNAWFRVCRVSKIMQWKSRVRREAPPLWGAIAVL